MNTEELKHVVGSATPGKPAVIRFFDSVTRDSVRDFQEEFLWLQDCVRPSKIVVLINSDGGSVMYGMSVFSLISNCPIEVDCVIEGIAASMGSVIWSAGDNLYMHDYSVLMIHNPFNSAGSGSSEAEKAMVEAFRSQLETVYRGRFGFDAKKTRDIMNGEGEVKATYFSASEAVKAGIIPRSNVIRTSKAVMDKAGKACAACDGDAAKIRAAMENIAQLPEVIANTENIESIIHKNNKQTHSEMEENLFLNTNAAQLGMTEANAAAVAARVAELSSIKGELGNVKSELATAKNTVAELQTRLAGKETEASNLKANLDKAQARLKAYEDAEKAARTAEIENIVNAAVEAGKIKAESKADWVKMAEGNLDLVRATLDGIPAVEKISDKIAADAARDAAESREATLGEIDARIKAVVGNDFKFMDPNNL